MPAEPENKPRSVAKILAASIVLCAVAFIVARVNERVSFKQEVLTPSLFVVGAGSISSFPFDVYKTGHILGRFQAAENGHADESGTVIKAVIVDARDLENWKKGLPVRFLYRSEKTARGGIEVRVPPGKYYLAFDNRLSPLADKTITADIVLNQ